MSFCLTNNYLQVQKGDSKVSNQSSTLLMKLSGKQWQEQCLRDGERLLQKHNKLGSYPSKPMEKAGSDHAHACCFWVERERAKTRGWLRLLGTGPAPGAERAFLKGKKKSDKTDI